jgi:hypothetical protein
MKVWIAYLKTIIADLTISLLTLIEQTQKGFYDKYYNNTFDRFKQTYINFFEDILQYRDELFVID